MCGLAGIVDLNRQKVRKEDLEKMIMLIKHRGPDDEGYFIDENVGLGHCRLSIIDLSLRGHQPMINKEGRFIIVYNGEIYNYLEIRKELKDIGYRFISDTDTEVVLYAYQEWGKTCLEKFNGMWALAIYDRQKRELFCARDRFGIKPFYYYFDGKLFAFSSEIKSLLKLNLSNKPNDKVIYDFLKFGMADHTEDTFFKGVKRLLPAYWLIVNLEEAKIEKGKYWNLKICNGTQILRGNDKKYAQKFLDLFVDSVRLRLRSDVPVGSCLSGGLDSSAIVCVINNLLKGKERFAVGSRQRAFSACFNNRRLDERKYIQEVIRQTKADSNYIFPELTGLKKELEKLVWHQEEPFGGISIYAQWKVFSLAKTKGVKVLLDGQGGDENLCGYRKFYMFFLRKLLEDKKYLLFVREALSFFSSWEILSTLFIKNGLRYLPLYSRLFNVDSFFKDSFIKKWREELSHLDFGYNSSLHERLKEDIEKWSLPVLLRYEDRNSMAHSLETRLPFLDYRLVEFIASLPFSQKMRGGKSKFVVRKALRGILPEKIRLRKSKLGFDV
ncbi:MAG: asparagine synthase (glutamine-hydrolyzing), partial [Candidatus Omnitrophota bacterium]